MSYRALRKGFLVATRTKRTWGFIAVFVILTMLAILFINNVHAYETDDVLEVRGYVVTPKDIMPRSEFEREPIWGTLRGEITRYARGVYVVFGAVVELRRGARIGIAWLEPIGGVKYEPEMPWVVSEVKPTKIIEGEPLDLSAHQAVVGRDFSVTFPVDGSNITLSMPSGSLIFETTRGRESVEIVGVSSESFSLLAKKLPGVTPSSVVFTTKTVYESLHAVGVSGIDDVYVIRIIVTARGGGLSPRGLMTISDIDKNRDYIEETLGGVLGDKFEPVTIEKRSSREYLRALSLAVGFLLMTCALALFYAFILVSFRKFDVATLRAIGWGSNHIRALVVGEFTLTIFAGYVIGSLLSIPVLLYYRLPVSGLEFLVAFAIIVFSMIVGLIIISYRVLKIPPMEAFRAR